MWKDYNEPLSFILFVGVVFVCVIPYTIDHMLIDVTVNVIDCDSYDVIDYYTTTIFSHYS